MSTETRNSVIAALASLHAGMDTDETAAKAVDDNSSPWEGQWQARDGYLETRSGIALAVGTGRYAGRDMIAAGVLEHAARHDPARALREVTAMRSLIAAILAEPHDYIPGDEFYSCSQAVDPDPAPGEGGPGSGCSNPDRAGQPCDCGRDARAERLLSILAGIYDETGGGKS